MLGGTITQSPGWRKTDTVKETRLLYPTTGRLFCALCVYSAAEISAAQSGHSSQMWHLVPSSLQVWPLFSPLWAEVSPPLAESHQSCVLWWRGTGVTVSAFCRGRWWTPTQNWRELKPFALHKWSDKGSKLGKRQMKFSVCQRVWRCLHSEQWRACHLCPSHLGPACPGQLPAPVYCPLWWDRAASGRQTPHNYTPGCPKMTFAYTITNTTVLVWICQTTHDWQTPAFTQLCLLIQTWFHHCSYCIIPCSSRGDPPASRWTGQSFWHCVYWTHWRVWQLDPVRWCTRGCSLWGGRTGFPIWNEKKDQWGYVSCVSCLDILSEISQPGFTLTQCSLNSLQLKILWLLTVKLKIVWKLNDVTDTKLTGYVTQSLLK